jgi:hypothetical protein
MKKRLCAWLLGTLTALAAPAGFVVRVEGSRIVVNRGSLDQVQVGDHFTVVRQGRNIADLVVENVTPQECHTKVAQLYGQEQVLAGDALSGSPAANAPTQIGTKTPKATTPMQLAYEQSRQDYEQMLSSRTQKQEFQQKWSGRAGVSDDFNEYSWTAILDGLGYAFLPYGGWIGPVDMLLRSANQALMNHHLHDRMMKDYMARIEIEVVRWDESLTDAFCRMQAAQSGFTSVEEFNAMKSQMVKEKALDQNDVFQVRIRNVGELNVEMAPFHWHMFLSAPGDQKVVSARYDQVLDRKLSPNQEVVGYISFPKVADREELTVFLEDIYGDRGEFSFSR